MSGIGRAATECLPDRGARVAVLDLDVGAVTPDAIGIRADVTSRASVDAAVREAAEAFGGLDVVVNNAGIGAQGTVEDNDDTEWARVLDIRVTGMARVAAAALPWLRRSPARPSSTPAPSPPPAGSPAGPSTPRRRAPSSP